VDRDRCIGSGQCVLAAADVFDQDDDAVVTLLTPTPSAEAQADVRHAAEGCPAAAITVTEDAHG